MPTLPVPLPLHCRPLKLRYVAAISSENDGRTLIDGLSPFAEIDDAILKTSAKDRFALPLGWRPNGSFPFRPNTSGLTFYELTKARPKVVKPDVERCYHNVPTSALDAAVTMIAVGNSQRHTQPGPM